MQDRLQELNKFIAFKEYFQKSHPHYTELDQYGFALTQDKKKLDIFFTGLTHGNELIGIEIINLMLEQLKQSGSDKNIGFLLNNIEAYKRNVRFIESDLNRSFCRDSIVTLEHQRAREIENILNQFEIPLLIDLHQTSEPSLGVFMLVPEIPEHIQRACNITNKCDIITFSASTGFSNIGKTLGEFINQKGTIEVVFELGQKGFNPERASEFCDLLLNIDLNNLKNTSNEPIKYMHLQDKVPINAGFSLIEGICNLTPVKKDQRLSRLNDPEYLCPMDAVIIFPRYTNITDSDTELALLAVAKST